MTEKNNFADQAKKATRQRTDDQLWKAVIEQVFEHFLTFFFKDAKVVFYLEKPPEYLDKEFESLFPTKANGKGVRYVDKLIKVHLKNDGEQFILIHIEVQSSKGKGDLGKRMFQYYYKIAEKYHVPITAIAILADENKSYRPTMYRQGFMGTSLIYTFNSYKILDQREEILRADPNPLAVVVLTALLAIRHRNIIDEQLMELKLDLYDAMMERNMDRDTRKGIYDFLAHYVHFENLDNFNKFVKSVEAKLGRSTTMGTEEYLLDKWKRDGIAEGVEKGRAEEKAKVEAEKRAVVRNLIAELGLADDAVARIAEVSLDFVQKVRTDFNKKK